MSAKLLIASRNQHKIGEIIQIINDGLGKDYSKVITSAYDLDLPEVVENGITLLENATLKSQHYFELTKIPSLSDDSGLFIEVFGNAPGIFSARWAGEDSNSGDIDQANRQLILEQIKDIDDPYRKAYFATQCVLISENKIGDFEVSNYEGRNEGKILKQEIGENGFGYDSIFESIEFPNLSLAQLSSEQKNSISHRARAVRGLLPEIKKVLGD